MAPGNWEIKIKNKMCGAWEVACCDQLATTGPLCEGYSLVRQCALKTAQSCLSIELFLTPTVLRRKYTFCPFR